MKNKKSATLVTLFLFEHHVPDVFADYFISVMFTFSRVMFLL